jgi:hypothetical protein
MKQLSAAKARARIERLRLVTDALNLRVNEVFTLKKW